MNAHANLTVEFCEGRYGGLRRLFATTPMPEAAYLPEPLSCASALFIGAVGVHLFCQWRVGSGILRLLAACFIVNGIASFAYHYSADPLWGRIDGSSMLLAVYLTIGLLMDQLLSELLDIAASSNYGDTGSAAIWKVVLRPLIRAHRRTFRHGGCAQLVCSSSIWSCALLVMLWLFFGEPPQDAFVKAFAIPLVLMLLCATLIMLMPLSLKPGMLQSLINAKGVEEDEQRSRRTAPCTTIEKKTTRTGMVSETVSNRNQHSNTTHPK